MKFAFAFIATFLLVATSFAQQTSDSTQDPSALGNAFFKSLLDEDGTTLGKLVASDFTITSFDGNTVDGEMLVQGVSGGFVVIETATVSDARTRQYNSDAAVMTGNWKAKGNVQGQTFDAGVAFSVMCAKQANAWKIVHVQFTPMHP